MSEPLVVHRATRRPWLERARFALFVSAAAVLPLVVTAPKWQTAMLLVVINACGALGLTVLYGLAGQISLAQASFLGIGAYAPAVVGVHLGLNPWWGLPIGMLAAFLTAVVVGIPVLRLEGLHLAIATAALSVIFVVTASQLTSITGGPFGLAGLTPISFFGTELFAPRQIYYPALAAIIVLLLITSALIRSPFGLMFTAMGHNSRAAGLAGVRVPALKVKVFALSAVYAAVGGFFLAEYLLVVVPESFSLLPALLFLVMVVVGGSRSLYGAIIGAAFITIIPVLIPQYPRTQQLLFAGCFLIAVIALPDGLLGGVERLTAAVRRAIRNDRPPSAAAPAVQDGDRSPS